MTPPPVFGLPAGPPPQPSHWPQQTAGQASVPAKAMPRGLWLPPQHWTAKLKKWDFVVHWNHKSVKCLSATQQLPCCITLSMTSGQHDPRSHISLNDHASKDSVCHGSHVQLHAHKYCSCLYPWTVTCQLYAVDVWVIREIWDLFRLGLAGDS